MIIIGKVTFISLAIQGGLLFFVELIALLTATLTGFFLVYNQGPMIFCLRDFAFRGRATFALSLINRGLDFFIMLRPKSFTRPGYRGRPGRGNLSYLAARFVAHSYPFPLEGVSG